MTLLDELDVLIERGIYSDQEALIEDALRALLRSKPDLRRQLAIELYKQGRISLSRGAEIEGVDIESFKESLREAGVEIAEARVAVLGYAYRENSDDTRNSPSEVLVTRLRELGAEVVIHDPHVRAYQGDLEEHIRGCDAVVVMVAHDTYRTLDLDTLRATVDHALVIDGRHIFAAERARASGWIYGSVGLGGPR